MYSIGKLPTDLCNHDPRGSTIRKEFFVQGTQPTEFCDTHVELEIDTTTNKIANEYCPKDSVEKKVFIQREPPYNPEDHNGILPSDYQYTAPTEICDEHNQENWLSDWLNDLINNGNGNDNDEDDGLEDNDNGNGMK